MLQIHAGKKKNQNTLWKKVILKGNITTTWIHVNMIVLELMF